MRKLTQREILPGSEEYKAVKALYDSAFGPVDDLDIMMEAAGTGKAVLYAYYCGDALAAFAFALFPGHYCYVLYSALTEELRHRGLIRELIDCLRASHPRRPFIFDIETPSSAAADREERQYRYEMFSHLGFRDSGYGMTDAGGTYTIFCESPFDEQAFRESWDILPETFCGTTIFPFAQHPDRKDT